jgi:Tfp pilus assembly protein PilO
MFGGYFWSLFPQKSILSVAFNFLYEPIIGRNENLNKEINFTRAKLEKYLQLLSQKDYIQKKYSKYRVSTQNSEAGTDMFVNALSEIERLAKESGIIIADIRPQSQKSPDLYKERLINLRTEGAMEGYLKFIYNIENSLSLLKIRRFQLTAKPNSQSLGGNLVISQLLLD